MSNEEYGVCPVASAVDFSGIALSSVFQLAATYPTQLSTAPTVLLGGELRGFYSGDRWKPFWSKFAHPRGSTTGYAHKGVDIYAPIGTPLVASMGGSLTFHTDPPGLGLYAQIEFLFKKDTWLIRYGHLQAANGKDRSVVRGEVIGLAGCSGNAGGSQPCATPNSCGKYSTHVHVAIKAASTGFFLDPVRSLGWQLDFQSDARDVLCKDL